MKKLLKDLGSLTLAVHRCEKGFWGECMLILSKGLHVSSLKKLYKPAFCKGKNGKYTKRGEFCFF